jgi:hypothetical protein
MKKILLLLSCLCFLAAGRAQNAPVQNAPAVSPATLLKIKVLLIDAKGQLDAQATKIGQLEVDNASVTSALDEATTNAVVLAKQIQEVGNERDQAVWDKGVAEQKQAKAEAKTKAIQANLETVLKVEHLLIGLVTLFIISTLVAAFKPFLTTLWATGPIGIAASIGLPLLAYGAIFTLVTLALDRVVKFIPIPG